ncbi:MAG: DUF5060 domain-containing protein [Pricia sp.]
MRRIIIFVLTLLSSACEKQAKFSTNGELKKWHRITLVFEGPETSEIAKINPFLDYRLDVTFSNGGKNYLVPGFYAGDGSAAETSGNSGKVWKTHFTPDEVGEWKYTVSFKKGNDVAVADRVDNEGNLESAGFMDGATGTFTVTDTDKSIPDNRARGKLEYVGESYLKYAESGDYFIKVGVDAPENLLGYADFDAPTNALDFLKTWEPHAQDFETDAEPFTWQNGKGKNLLGAINYLASEGLNVFSFLTFNVDGDDRNIFPYLLKVPVEEYESYASDKKNKEAWETMFHKTRFDVSKLEQWERIFDYAERKGMFLHFKTNETETDHLMDGGVFGTEGKLYYRELIARFGHHLALNWNLGEENDQPIENVIEVAEYIKAMDAYDHHRVVHTFPNKDDRYQKLIGNQSVLTGASLQLSDAEFNDVHERVLKWKRKSDSTDVKWALAVDEPGKANIALLPDDEDPSHNLPRSRALWGTLMAGGYGVEWYFGYDSPNSDLTAQDFRSRDDFWEQNKYAHQFFTEQLPFWEMENADELTEDDTSYCFAKSEEVYAVYLHPEQRTTRLDLGESGKTFTIQWFDPRNGGGLQEGSVPEIRAEGGLQSLGNPPSDPEKDWVMLVKGS